MALAGELSCISTGAEDPWTALSASVPKTCWHLVTEVWPLLCKSTSFTRESSRCSRLLSPGLLPEYGTWYADRSTAR